MATRSSRSRSSKTGGSRRAGSGSAAGSRSGGASSRGTSSRGTSSRGASSRAASSRGASARAGASRGASARGSRGASSSRKSSGGGREELGSLAQLFVDQLADVYSAEKQILTALPKMARAASSPELREAFETHLEETRAQVERLDQVVQGLGQRLPNKKCRGMEGLIEEGKEVLEADGEPSVRDAGLIAAAQKIEHYEMASYGSLRAFAEELGNEDASALLQQTLEEEGKTDHLLSQLAESTINSEAHRAEASQ